MMFDTTVWIAQGFLALFFLYAGVPKVAGAGLDRWIGFDGVPRAMTALIGASELAGAVALVVPPLVHRAEWATPLGGIGLAVVSLMASGFHLRNREWFNSAETALLAALSGAVAAARWSAWSTGPSVSARDVLPPLLVVLLVATCAVLTVLTRAMAAPAPAAEVPAERDLQRS